MTLPRSLADNNLTNRGKDMSGVLKLAEALPQSKLENLKCAAAHMPAFCVQGPMNTFTFPTPFLSLVAVCSTTISALKPARHSRKPSQNHR